MMGNLWRESVCISAALIPVENLLYEPAWLLWHGSAERIFRVDSAAWACSAYLQVHLGLLFSGLDPTLSTIIRL